MSGLVGYASSDEEEEVPSSRPTKVARTANASDAVTRAGTGLQPQPKQPAREPQPHPIPAPTDAPTAGPSAGPQRPHPEASSAPQTPPASPYTTERALLRTLTMPTHPNFDIPPSPPPPTGESAVTLASTTKKFTRFLELKAQQGLHINARLEGSAALRNPGVGARMREFAGVEGVEEYASTLSDGLGVPVVWPEEWYVEELVRENERRVKRAGREREGVEFVKAGKGSEHRKSKFER